jgi:hypothetical protein
MFVQNFCRFKYLALGFIRHTIFFREDSQILKKSIHAFLSFWSQDRIAVWGESQWLRTSKISRCSTSNFDRTNELESVHHWPKFVKNGQYNFTFHLTIPGMKLTCLSSKDSYRVCNDKLLAKKHHPWKWSKIVCRVSDQRNPAITWRYFCRAPIFRTHLPLEIIRGFRI